MTNRCTRASRQGSGALYGSGRAASGVSLSRLLDRECLEPRSRVLSLFINFSQGGWSASGQRATRVLVRFRTTPRTPVRAGAPADLLPHIARISSQTGIQPLSNSIVGVLLGVRTCAAHETMGETPYLHELFDSAPGHRTAAPRGPSACPAPASAAGRTFHGITDSHHIRDN